MDSYDVVVVGAGPAGSTAAWRAASAGAKVLLVDKAVFPRDKPCGDGLTPRATKLLADIGLEHQLERFHRVNRIRLFHGRRTREYPWPKREGFPTHGYVISRMRLDDMLVRHAAAAGALVSQGSHVIAPVIDDDVVTGVRVRSGGREEEIRSRIVIAADGASSVLGRAMGMVPNVGSPLGMAARALIASERPDDDALEVYTIRHHRGFALGYAWLFPLGNGLLNIGMAVHGTDPRWREVGLTDLMQLFLNRLPAEWRVPSLAEIRREGTLKAWRVPMCLAVWPPWSAGILAAGDAAGVAKPTTGGGISKAIQSGLISAEVALEALDTATGPRDLSTYEKRLEDTFGKVYETGRRYLRVMSSRVARRLLLTGPGIRLAARKMVGQADA